MVDVLITPPAQTRTGQTNWCRFGAVLAFLMLSCAISGVVILQTRDIAKKFSGSTPNVFGDANSDGCDRMTDVTNGMTICTRGSNSGSACSVICYPLYRPVGPLHRTCLKSGLWSGADGVTAATLQKQGAPMFGCKKITCPALTVDTRRHGVQRIAGDEQVACAADGEARPYATCSFETCDPGYQFSVEGADTVGCLSNGSWSAKPKTCVPIVANSPCTPSSCSKRGRCFQSLKAQRRTCSELGLPVHNGICAFSPNRVSIHGIPVNVEAWSEYGRSANKTAAFLKIQAKAATLVSSWSIRYSLHHHQWDSTRVNRVLKYPEAAVECASRGARMCSYGEVTSKPSGTQDQLAWTSSACRINAKYSGASTQTGSGRVMVSRNENATTSYCEMPNSASRAAVMCCSSERAQPAWPASCQCSAGYSGADCSVATGASATPPPAPASVAVPKWALCYPAGMAMYRNADNLNRFARLKIPSTFKYCAAMQCSAAPNSLLLNKTLPWSACVKQCQARKCSCAGYEFSSRRCILRSKSTAVALVCSKGGACKALPTRAPLQYATFVPIVSVLADTNAGIALGNLRSMMHTTCQPRTGGVLCSGLKCQSKADDKHSVVSASATSTAGCQAAGVRAGSQCAQLQNGKCKLYSGGSFELAPTGNLRTQAFVSVKTAGKVGCYAKPCRNGGVCSESSVRKAGFMCSCPWRFTSKTCEVDITALTFAQLQSLAPASAKPALDKSGRCFGGPGRFGSGEVQFFQAKTPGSCTNATRFAGAKSGSRQYLCCASGMYDGPFPAEFASLICGKSTLDSVCKKASGRASSHLRPLHLSYGVPLIKCPADSSHRCRTRGAPCAVTVAIKAPSVDANVLALLRQKASTAQLAGLNSITVKRHNPQSSTFGVGVTAVRFDVVNSKGDVLGSCTTVVSVLKHSQAEDASQSGEDAQR